MRDGLVELAEFAEYIGKVIESPGVIRLENQHPSIARQGLVQVALLREDVAELQMRLGIIRIEIDRPLIARDGIRKLALVPQNSSKVAPRLSGRCLDLWHRPMGRHDFIALEAVSPSCPSGMRWDARKSTWMRPPCPRLREKWLSLSRGIEPGGASIGSAMLVYKSRGTAGADVYDHTPPQLDGPVDWAPPATPMPPRQLR